MFASARQFRIGKDKLAEGSIVADVADAAACRPPCRRRSSTPGVATLAAACCGKWDACDRSIVFRDMKGLGPR
jgi:hypothetical protein